MAIAAEMNEGITSSPTYLFELDFRQTAFTVLCNSCSSPDLHFTYRTVASSAHRYLRTERHYI